MKDNTKSVVLTTRLNEEYSQQFEQLCQKKRRKRADMIRIIVEDYLNLIGNE